jgi:CheY-like chemotaxis protein
MSKHILLIDDDRDDAEIFSDALSELTLEAVLHHYDDGLKALENLEHQKEQKPDIIFLDVNMPVINGWDCLRRIKSLASFEEIPIVMYSTSDLSREGVNAQDIGATAFLTKPTHFNDLKDKLSKLFKKLL